MKILHVARRFTLNAWGGTEAVVSALAREQQRAGHLAQVYCTAALDRPGPDAVLGIPVRRFGYTYGRFPLRHEAREALDRKGGNPLSAGLLWASLREPGLDLLHCHTMQRLAAQELWAARRRRIPYVLQLHGGQFDVPAQEVAQMREPARGTLDWGRLPSALLRTRRHIEAADLVLVLSARELALARERHPHTRFERLPNGVEPGTIRGGNRERARQAWRLPQGAVASLTVARIDPQKNQLALPAVLAAVPELYAILAGPVTVPGYDRQILEEAERLGVADRLRLLGSLRPESDELRDAYAGADLFILPSRHEPFGIVALEAWAAGLPIVASRVGGLVDFVEHDLNGLLVEAGDSVALAGAVRALARSPELRGRLAAEGERTMESNYTWKAVAQRLETMYAELIEEARR